MKITFTYTNKWDLYDLVGLAFALIMSIWIGKFMSWGFVGIAFTSFVLGLVGPHLAAFLRHPPKDFDSTTKNSG